MRYLARIGGRDLAIEVERRGGSAYTVRLDGAARAVERRGDGVPLVLSLDERTCEAMVERAVDQDAGSGETSYDVAIGGRHYSVRLVDPLRRAAAGVAVAHKGPVDVRSIMPGKIVALLADEGQEVTAGQGVVVVEAMKMANELTAPRGGRVARLRVRPGETVEAGAVLFTVE